MHAYKFEFSNVEVFSEYSLLTRSQYFNAIRCLRINFNLDISLPMYPSFQHKDRASSQRWSDVWDTVAGMQDLRDLEVSLSVPNNDYRHRFAKDEDAILWPLCAVTIGWHLRAPADGTPPTPDRPFQIVKRNPSGKWREGH